MEFLNLVCCGCTSGASAVPLRAHEVKVPSAPSGSLEPGVRRAGTHRAGPGLIVPSLRSNAGDLDPSPAFSPDARKE